MKHFLFVLSLFIYTTIRAQNPSCEVYASQRKPAGNYVIETSGSVYDIGVKVYDEKNTVLSGSQLPGYVGFYYPDGSYLKREFTRIPNTSTFTVKIPYPGFLAYRVTLTIGGKVVSAEFENVWALKTQPD